MTRETEDLLRSAIKVDAETYELQHDFVGRTLAASQARRTSRKGRGVVLASAGAVAVVTLGAVASAHIAQPTDDATKRGQVAQPPGSVSEASAFEWAQTLPAGRDDDVAIVIGDTLYSGAHAVQMPGEFGSVAARVGSQWLVLASDGTGPGTAGLLGENGHFSDFGRPLSTESVRGNPVAPDGSLIVLGDNVVDTESGKPVSTVPPNLRVAVIWTTAGLVYQDKASNFFVWTPGGDPSQIEAGFFDRDIGAQVFSSSGIGITKQGGCLTLHRLNADGGIDELATICDEQLAYASLDGSEAVTSTGRVVNVQTGAQTDQLALPDTLREIPVDSNVTWDPSRALIFTVTDKGYTVDHELYTPTVLVRCPVDGGSCDRISPVLDDITGDAYPVPLT